MIEQSKTSRTQAQRKEEAIRKILDSAIELIAQRGVKDLTMAEIGIHAGYSRGLPHQHFGSKENLIEAVLHSIVEKFNDRRKKLPASADGLESIKALFSTYLERDPASWQASKAFIILVADASLTESPNRAFINKLNKKNIEFIAKHISIARGGNSTEIGNNALAIILMSTMRGLALQALTDSTKDFNEVQFALNQLLDRVLVGSKNS